MYSKAITPRSTAGTYQRLLRRPPSRPHYPQGLRHCQCPSPRYYTKKYPLLPLFEPFIPMAALRPCLFPRSRPLVPPTELVAIREQCPPGPLGLWLAHALGLLYPCRRRHRHFQHSSQPRPRTSTPGQLPWPHICSLHTITPTAVLVLRRRPAYRTFGFALGNYSAGPLWPRVSRSLPFGRSPGPYLRSATPFSSLPMRGRLPCGLARAAPPSTAPWSWGAL